MSEENTQFDRDGFDDTSDSEEEGSLFLGFSILTGFLLLWLAARALVAGLVFHLIARLLIAEESIQPSFWHFLLAGLIFEVWWFVRKLMNQDDDDEDDDFDDDDDEGTVVNSESTRALDKNSG